MLSCNQDRKKGRKQYDLLQTIISLREFGTKIKYLTFRLTAANLTKDLKLSMSPEAHNLESFKDMSSCRMSHYHTYHLSHIDEFEKI